MQRFACELVFPTCGIGTGHCAKLSRVGTEKYDGLRGGIYGTRRLHLLKNKK